MDLSNFDGRRLRRAWWLTPAYLTLILFVLIDMLVASVMPRQIIGSNAPAVSPETIALYLTGFFALWGLLRGFSFAQSAGDVLKVGLGVTNLPDNNALTRRVHGLAKKLGLPPPKVAVMRTANAYAIGNSTKDAAVVLGRPLLQSFSSDELDAIIGHELGHIVSGDMRRMQCAEGFQEALSDFWAGLGHCVGQQLNSAASANLARALGLLARKTVFLLTETMVMWTSRNREYAADAVGAVLTTPEAMASALRKIHALPAKPTAVESQYACLMFRGGMNNLFSTHPTLEQRIAALEQGGHTQAILTRAASPGLRASLRPVTKSAWEVLLVCMKFAWTVLASGVVWGARIAERNVAASACVVVGLAFTGGMMVF